MALPLADPGMETPIRNALGRLGGNCTDERGLSQLARMEGQDDGQLPAGISRPAGTVALIQPCAHCGFPQAGQGGVSPTVPAGARPALEVLGLHAHVTWPVGTGHPLCRRSCSSSGNDASNKADPILTNLRLPSSGRTNIDHVISGTARHSEEDKIFVTFEGQVEGQWLGGSGR